MSLKQMALDGSGGGGRVGTTTRRQLAHAVSKSTVKTKINMLPAERLAFGLILSLSESKSESES